MHHDGQPGLTAVTTVFARPVKGQVNISNLVIRRTIIVTVFGLWLLSHK